MKTEYQLSVILESGYKKNLSHLLDVLVSKLEIPAIQNRSLVINDIPDNIEVDTDEYLLSAILSGIMTRVITHTENGSIRITAKNYNSVILIHIKNDGILQYESIVHHMPVLQAQAEKLGGFIGFTSFRNQISTIAFSFTNKKNILDPEVCSNHS
ncbi:MAG: HAMP domain-containing histidine kinase [Chitinophagaceae bacterium]|nr:HAMP domain-containing histidine kinase [Chitinophagaceae bacterium]